ncbi:MAG: hypothetical protein COW08_07100 [Ignavibacteriales bacterium CG12_big_fil_rev_8_21_14_0_65_30_8]|nr:MAG: hypothetical protein COW08_07100 [Ignavibacteriales bacterium CG12_big_fil_rev_8_21_14_0_65_30_8]
MNKAELIRAISKRAGIPDTNAKLFFEVLLKRLSETLQPGQAADISGIGFLQLRKGKLQTSDKTEDDPVIKEDLNLIVFYENADEPNTNNIIFNIPEIESHPKDSIEQTFSLSIGKPVIPLKGVNENDYKTPVTGKELKNLVSSRVEILLSEINIIRDYAKGSEVLLITPTKYSRDQFEIKWDDLVDDKVDEAEEKNINDKKSVEKIEWEFGSELSKEIDEESLLDINKDEPSLISPKSPITEDEKKDISWNFGITQEEILPTEEIKEKVDEDKDEIEKDKTKEVVDKKDTDTVKDKTQEVVDKKETDTVKDKTQEVVDEKEPDIPQEKDVTDEKPEYQKIDTLYERLKSQKKIQTDEFDFTWSFGETLEIDKIKEDTKEVTKPRKQFPEKPIIKGKKEIPKSKITKDRTDKTIEKKTEPKKDISKEEISKEDKVSFSTLRPTVTRPTITKEEIKKDKTTDRFVTKPRTSTYQHTGTYSKKGTAIPFFIGIFVIITVGVLLIHFLTDIDLDFFNLSKKDTHVTTNKLFAGTNIIERNYDVPVSFSSDKNVVNIVPVPVKKKSVVKTPPKKTNIKNTPKKDEPKTLDLKRIKGLKETMNDVVKATKNKELNIPAKVEKKDPAETSDLFTFENLPDPIDTTKLNPNIFSDQGTYSVQVSSWQQLSTAESEVAKFKNKGYDAYVAEALIPGKGIWYRVRVRNFKSVREAEDFLQLYQ